MFGYPSLQGWKGFANILLNMILATTGGAKSPDFSHN